MNNEEFARRLKNFFVNRENAPQSANVNISDEFSIVDSEIRLIDQLRREAEGVKDCYTQFTFKAWTFVSAMVALQFGVVKFSPAASFAAPLTIFILLAVVRIGQHKYTTANRHFGFELYLNRRRRFNTLELRGSWQPYMRKIGWEEAHYAWRIVQASLYDEIYGMTFWRKLPFTKFGPLKLYSKFCPLIGQTPKGPAVYHAGGYLAKTAFVLHFFALFSLAPLLYVVVIEFDAEKWISNITTAGQIDWISFVSGYSKLLVSGDFAAISGLLFIPMVVLILLRLRRTNGKRICLESGLLSINSSAIVWNAVVIAHYRALSELEQVDEHPNKDAWQNAPRLDSYSGYSQKLGEQAAILQKCVRANPTEGIYEYCESSKTAKDLAGKAKKTAKIQWVSNKNDMNRDGETGISPLP